MISNKKNIVKQVLFGVILILLFMPFAIQCLKEKDTSDKLHGAFIETEYLPFSWENWFNQKYQHTTTSFLNENFGGRKSLVRFNSQRLYYMYRKSTVFNVIYGKDDYLFSKTYINAHTGTDFIGQDSIDQRVQKLKVIKDELAKSKTKIIVLLAPGKGSFIPEYIPSKYSKFKGVITNHYAYTKAFNKLGIDYLDFKSWFQEMKDTSSYPLYPKAGIHWSKYGEYLALDSLVNYIEKDVGQEIADVELQKITVEAQNRSGDYDIGDAQNLMFDLDTYPMAYPEYKLIPINKKDQPKVLVIADSYYWGMYNKGLSKDCFGNGQFWYYNKTIHQSGQPESKVSDIGIVKEAEKYDYIILLSTDGNLNKFAFGFVDNLYSQYVHVK